MTTARQQEERKKWIVIGVFSVLLLFVGYRVYDGFFGGTSAPPPPPVIVEAPGAAGWRPRRDGSAGQRGGRLGNQAGNDERAARPDAA